MRLAVLIGAGWIVASLVFFLVLAALASASYPEPADVDPEDDGLEDDELAAAAAALDDVYGEPAYRSARPGDRRSTAILERRVVRASGRRGLTPPRPTGLR